MALRSFAAKCIVFTASVAVFALPASGYYNAIDIIDHCTGHVSSSNLGDSQATAIYSQMGDKYYIHTALCRVWFTTDLGTNLFVSAEHLALGDNACITLYESSSENSNAKASAKYCNNTLFQFSATNRHLGIALTTLTETNNVGFRLVVTPVTPGASCPYLSFRCNSGDCISGGFINDGHRNCPDNTDEQNLPLTPCQNGLIKCEGSDWCIPDIFKCDRFDDCHNKWDEQNCFYKCPGDSESGSTYQLQCRDGNDCFYEGSRCNNYQSCSDRSDDMDCDSCDGIYYGDSADWYCAETRSCLSDEDFCNGVMDCPSGVDEDNDKCHPSIYLYWTSGQLAALFIGFIIFVFVVIAIVVVVHKKCQKQEV